MRSWSLLLPLAAIFGVGLPRCPVLRRLVAPGPAEPRPAVHPPGLDRRHSDRQPFVIILRVTGIVSVGIRVAPVRATWKFADGGQGGWAFKASYSHGSQPLEAIRTIIPAAILIFIALDRMGTRASVKFRSEQPKVPPLAEITGRQFRWVMRHPGPDGRLDRRPAPGRDRVANHIL